METLNLQQLLDEYAREGGDLSQLIQNPGDGRAVDLTALRQEAVEAFDTLYRSDALSEDDLAAMTALTSVVEAVSAEQTRLEGIATEQRTRAAELARSIGLEATEDNAGGETGAEGDGDAETGDNAGEGTPEAGAEGDPDPSDNADGGEGGDTVDVPDSPAALDNAGTAPAEPTGDLVTASVQPRRGRVNLASIAARRPAARPPVNADSGLGQYLTAAADVPGVSTGAPFNSYTELAEAAMRRFGAMPRNPRVGGTKELRYGLATIRKPESLSFEGLSEQDAVDEAARETRLQGGSLVAAGGWCGPADRWLDLCELRDSNDGLFDVPEVNLTRGRVEYWQGPDYCAMWDMVDAGFFRQTSAQADAGLQKNCVEIPCPEDPQMAEQEAFGLCITAGILTQRSWPEWISRFIQFALRAHARRMSIVKLDAVYDGSLDLGTVALGLGATSNVLNAIELEVEWLRYRERMARNASVELVAPYWIRPAIRADLANREGVDVFEITDDRVTRWFTSRGVRIQWVYDWQPISGCGQIPPGGIAGTPLPITNYPGAVEFLMYPSGTWVAASQDILTLDTLYSPEMLRTNRYQALWTEEALAMIQRCPGSYRFTVPVCTNGAIGDRLAFTCPPAVPLNGDPIPDESPS